MAFVLVSGAVVVLRRTKPNLERTFRCRVCGPFERYERQQERSIEQLRGNVGHTLAK